MADELREVRAADGTDLRYEVAGPESRRPLALLHGSLANRAAFRKVRPALAGAHRLILTVLRGHEGATPALPADYGLATTEVDDLLTILDAEGVKRADVLAHSTGGSIAVAFAGRHPGRVGRMVLVEPTLMPLLRGEIGVRVRADSEAVVDAGRRGQHTAALRGLLDFVGGTAWKVSTPEARQRVVDALTPVAPLAAPHAAALVALHVDDAAIGSIAAPTLLIYGRESAYFEAPTAARLAELRPDIDQLHVDGAGHNVHLDRPDVVASATLAFLAEET